VGVAVGTGTWGMRDIYYATHSKRPECHRNLPRYDTRHQSSGQEVMRSLDVRPRQLARVTGMNYETIRNIAKKIK